MPYPTPSPVPITAAEQDDIDHARAALHDLIDRAHELACLAHQAALAQATQMAAEPGRHHTYIDFTIPFERAARCVRRCILLRQKLHEPRPTGYDIALAAQKRALPAPDTDAPERSEIEQAERAERLDRLDDDHFNDMDRPMGEIIAEICADLRIAPPQVITGWALRTPNDLVAAASADRTASRRATLSITAAIPPGAADPPPYPLRL